MALYAVDLGQPPPVLGHRQSRDPDADSSSRSPVSYSQAHRRGGLPAFPCRLYGVGNDSRVYVLDTVTALATPVAAEPFKPPIDIFEVHFWA